MGASASNEKYSKPARKLGQKANDWKGFVNIPLTEDDIERIASDDWSCDDLWQAVSVLVENSYKLSFSPDFEHHCVIASITGRKGADANEGYSLSARGPDIDGALRALWYKHTVLCEGDSWSAKENAVPRPSYG